MTDVEVRCEVNEEVRQLGRTKDMVFDPPTLVSYVSHVMTLLPGDVILTGTPAGVGPLVDGDWSRCGSRASVTLTNPVAGRWTVIADLVWDLRCASGRVLSGAPRRWGMG